MLVRAGDLDVVAEDVVEAHLEGGDARALALARLDLGNVLLAVLAEIAQIVELGMESGANRAAVHQVERRFIGDRPEDEAADVGQLIEAVVQVAQARGLLGVEAAFERGDLFQGPAKREQVAGAGRAEGDLGEQAFQIENAGELLAQFGSQNRLLAQFAHCVEALLDFGAVHRWAQQALAQQAATHAGKSLIEHAEYGQLALRCAGIGSEDGLEQFEIAHCDGVEHHRIGAVVVGGPVEMVQGRALCVAQVMQDGAGCADGGGPIRKAAAIERE